MPLDAQRILIPINNSPHSEHAFRWACHMAKDAHAELLALHVIEVPLEMSLEAEVTEDIEEAEQLLTRYEQIARHEKKPKLTARCVRGRQAGAAVAKEAEIEQVDLVIVGIPYSRNLGQYRLGTTGSYIFQRTGCQVLLWREPMPPNHLIEN
jgi:nucleotide-binding universal stress UspA family protein